MGASILIGVGGGIAAYKTATVCSTLGKQGYHVQVAMTKNATRFVQPITFQALTRNPVLTDTFDEPNAAEIAHIAAADRADLYLIAPATANLIAKLAHGIADDMVTTLALVTQAPVVIAPAMNVNMLAHPTVQANLATLRSRGVIVIEPGSGPLACGWVGKGRLAEPDDIVAVVQAVLTRTKDLTGRRVVVTAGPTVEDLDPVRFLSNSSTGKMGYAIAAAAVDRGAEVCLVSGPTQLPAVPGVEMRYIRSTEDLLHAVTAEIEGADVYISAAAPADFRPVRRLEHKWKKSAGIPTVELEPTPDVLARAGELRHPHQVFVGFAAETRDAVTYGREKLEKKNLDLVVVNDVTEPGAGFAVDTNRVVIVARDGDASSLPLMSKREVADRLLDLVVDCLSKSKPANAVQESGDNGGRR